jgi:hypothetical protein
MTFSAEDWEFLPDHNTGNAVISFILYVGENSINSKHYITSLNLHYAEEIQPVK